MQGVAVRLPDMRAQIVNISDAATNGFAASEICGVFRIVRRDFHEIVAIPDAISETSYAEFGHRDL